MKHKIEEIINICNVNAYEYKDDGYAHEVSISNLANKIMELLPRPRFPEKDGWPDEGLACLFKTRWGALIEAHIGLFDKLLERKDVVWYIPASEIINLVEGIGDRSI